MTWAHPEPDIPFALSAVTGSEGSVTQLCELELGPKGQTSTPGATSLLMTRPARSRGMRDWETVGTP